MTRRAANIFLPLFVATLIFWLAGYAGFAVSVIASHPPYEAIKSDAIVVLTGGPDRVNDGLDLLATGRAENLFISGVGTNVTQDELIALWRRDAAEIAPCCITLGHKARNTAENAEETREWIAQNPVKSIQLVTAGYHMPRAMIEFRRVLPGIVIHSYPVAGKPALPLLFAEYNKTIFSFLRAKFS